MLTTTGYLHQLERPAGGERQWQKFVFVLEIMGVVSGVIYQMNGGEIRQTSTPWEANAGKFPDAEVD